MKCEHKSHFLTISNLRYDDPIFTGTLDNQTDSANWSKLTGIDLTLCYAEVVELA